MIKKESFVKEERDQKQISPFKKRLNLFLSIAVYSVLFLGIVYYSSMKMGLFNGQAVDQKQTIKNTIDTTTTSEKTSDFTVSEEDKQKFFDTLSTQLTEFAQDVDGQMKLYKNVLVNGGVPVSQQDQDYSTSNLNDLINQLNFIREMDVPQTIEFQEMFNSILLVSDKLYSAIQQGHESLMNNDAKQLASIYEGEIQQSRNALTNSLKEFANRRLQYYIHDNDLPSRVVIENGINLEMHTEYSVYEKVNEQLNEQLNVMLKNKGDKVLTFGKYYQIEKLQNGSWYKIPFKKSIVFTDVGLSLKPGETYEQQINTKLFNYELSNGEYRVIKRLHTKDQQIIMISAYFKID